MLEEVHNSGTNVIGLLAPVNFVQTYVEPIFLDICHKVCALERVLMESMKTSSTIRVLSQDTSGRTHATGGGFSNAELYFDYPNMQYAQLITIQSPEEERIECKVVHVLNLDTGDVNTHTFIWGAVHHCNYIEGRSSYHVRLEEDWIYRLEMHLSGALRRAFASVFD